MIRAVVYHPKRNHVYDCDAYTWRDGILVLEGVKTLDGKRNYYLINCAVELYYIPNTPETAPEEEYHIKGLPDDHMAQKDFCEYMKNKEAGK